jgi:hypothetical protein
MHESRKSENNSWVVTPGGEAGLPRDSSMVDILSGPNAPLATAFQMCGWQVAVLDKQSAAVIISIAQQGNRSSETRCSRRPSSTRCTQPTTWQSRSRNWPGRGSSCHTGGEDWPDAYRLTPMDPEDAEACVVTYWHARRQEPVFQVYHGMLFGWPLAVTAFNRYPRL